jgi:DNA-binding transcriptional regulator YhcF (GntR family)
MEFQDNKAIFRQIADRLCEGIMAGDYPDDARIPSVRECAAALEVNVNTALRAYDLLQQSELIYNRRGMGYYVSPGAAERILQMRRSEFFQREIPILRQNMQRLGISARELLEQLQLKIDN